MVIDFFILFNSYPRTLHIWIAFFILCITLDILTIMHIITNKHEEPTSAMLWIFVVVDFHILGILAYLILGINRIKTKGVKIEKYNNSMSALRCSKGHLSSFLEQLIEFHPLDKNTPPNEYQHILDRIIPGTFPVTGNKIELLVDGTIAYPKMLNAISNAKKHINLQSYIITDDEVGQKIFKALEKKAKEGVKVKVLFDSLGSSKAYKSHFFKHWSVKSSNLEIKSFSRLNLLTPCRIQLRNHRKLLVCDGETAFVGGINISSENDINFTLKNKHIHDLHCKIEGPAVGEIQYIFLKDWSYVTKTHPLNLLSEINYFAKPQHCGNETVRAIASGPGQAYEASKKMFLTAITAAKKSVWIITPYFVPDSSFIQALCMLAAKNIDIRIIIPQNNNHWYVRYACRSIYNRLLHANIRIFEKTGNFSHVKAMLIDNQWSTMGSSNCDIRSFRLNYELDCVIEGNDFINKLHNQFIEELKASEEITLLMRRNRTFGERLLEDTCSLFTPVM
jgi:cardiolipin synthase A/B